jgi:hypothetical protein
MQPVSKYLSLFLLLLAIGCRNAEKDETTTASENVRLDTTEVKQVTNTVKHLTSFSDAPVFIQRFVDSVCGNKFLIAKQGERWASGCVRVKGEPHRQLLSASVNDTTFNMKYQSGGFVVNQHVMKINFKGSTITGFYVDSIRNPRLID